MNVENEPAPGDLPADGGSLSDDDRHNQSSQTPHSPVPPQWRRPRGVAPGTWDYVHQRAIADHYDSFVADTPLCRVDLDVLRSLFPSVEPTGGQTVLDLGCGSGRATIPLAKIGYDVVAVDLSWPMLRVVLEKVAKLQPPISEVEALRGRVLPVQANLVELGCLASESADHAICLFSTFGMIQGRENRRDMLRSVARVVRPGGKFLLHAHHRWAALREHRGIRRLAGSWAKSIYNQDSEFGDATYAYRGLDQMFMHRFTKRELRRDLVTSGWTVDQVLALSIDGASTNRPGWLPGGYFFVCHRGS